MKAIAQLNSKYGFTLIELIIVILLLAILAVNALPRFSSDGFDTRALSKEILSELRLIQIKNMHSANNADGTPRMCFWLKIQSSGYQQMKNCTLPTAVANSVPIPSTISITLGDYGFDQMGRPNQSCVGGCSININGNENAQIVIESEGYLHE